MDTELMGSLKCTLEIKVGDKVENKNEDQDVKGQRNARKGKFAAKLVTKVKRKVV